MTRRARLLARGLACALLAGLPAATALPAPAAAIVPDQAALGAWQRRIEGARTAVVQAQRRSDAAEQAVRKMRHRRRPRGEARGAIFGERSESRRALAEAERALGELLEQARRSGVPPGRLDDPSAPPADASESP